MSLKDMKQHIADDADDNGNLWYHLEGCKATYTPLPRQGMGAKNTCQESREWPADDRPAG